MLTFSMIFGSMLPIYVAGAVGIVARLSRILTAEADASLMRLTVNVLIPCLIFRALLDNPAASDPSNLLFAPLIGFGGLMVGYVLCWMAARAMRMDLVRVRTFSVVVGTYNYGYMALPIVMALFGRQTLGVLFVHNLGVDLGLWTVGVMLLRGSQEQFRWRQLLSGPVIAVCLGVFLNVCHLSGLVPTPISKSLEFIGNCALPLALVLTGATIFDFRNELALSNEVGSTVTGAFLRLGIIPMIFLMLAWTVPMSIDLKRVLAVQAAMPAAMFPIVLTRLYGGDVRLALRQVVVTSGISFFTIPLVIHFALKSLNL